MVEPILHYLIPVSLLLIFFPKHRKLILILSPLAILPDLDFIFRSHRTIHSIFFVLFVSVLISTLAYFYVMKKWRQQEKSRIISVFVLLISLFYLFSHLLLDLSEPGIALFWPFSSKLYGFSMSFFINPQTFAVGKQAVSFTNALSEATDVPKMFFLTKIGTVIIFLIIVLTAIKIFTLRKRELYGT